MPPEPRGTVVVEEFESGVLAGNPAVHEKGRSVYRVIFQAMTEAEGDPEIAGAIKRHFTKLHRFISNEVTSLQKAGAIRSHLAYLPSINDSIFILSEKLGPARRLSCGTSSFSTSLSDME